VDYQWQNMWPQQNNVRADMFEWLNGRISPDIRQINITAADHPVVTRCKAALETIKHALEKHHIHPLPRFVFLLDFICDAYKRLVEEHKQKTQPPAEPEILVYQPTPVPPQRKKPQAMPNRRTPPVTAPQ